MLRDLEWDGCVNVRDLGGLATGDGTVTRWRSVIRSDNPARLSTRGWAALEHYGVRTVITLRTRGTQDDEPDECDVPSDVAVTRVELEDATDPAFLERCVSTGWWTTPLQWSEMLQSWPERCAEAVAAVARAREGGVVVSCGVGRDRTGLVVFLLLALVGVSAETIAEDWMRSAERLTDDPLADQEAAFEVLHREQMTVLDAVHAASALEVEARLLAGGLTADDLATIRRRMTGVPGVG